MVVRANVKPMDGVPDADRIIFVDSDEQLAADVAACRDLGATEVFFDLQFAPGVESIADHLTWLERLPGSPATASPRPRASLRSAAATRIPLVVGDVEADDWPAAVSDEEEIAAPGAPLLVLLGPLRRGLVGAHMRAAKVAVRQRVDASPGALEKALEPLRPQRLGQRRTAGAQAMCLIALRLADGPGAVIDHLDRLEASGRESIRMGRRRGEMEPQAAVPKVLRPDAVGLGLWLVAAAHPVAAQEGAARAHDPEDLGEDRRLVFDVADRLLAEDQLEAVVARGRGPGTTSMKLTRASRPAAAT